MVGNALIVRSISFIQAIAAGIFCLVPCPYIQQSSIAILICSLNVDIYFGFNF